MAPQGIAEPQTSQTRKCGVPKGQNRTMSQKEVPKGQWCVCWDRTVFPGGGGINSSPHSSRAALSQPSAEPLPTGSGDAATRAGHPGTRDLISERDHKRGFSR